MTVCHHFIKYFKCVPPGIIIIIMMYANYILLVGTSNHMLTTGVHSCSKQAYSKYVIL